MNALGPRRLGRTRPLKQCASRLVRLGLAAAVLAGWAAADGAVEPLPPRSVVLTFDDAVKSHATFVAPLLEELGFSATFFITEGFEFASNKTDYLTWEEIRGLHDAGFEIGNHTRDHLGVSAKTLDQLPAQIEAINARCREYGIPAPVSFAYPGNGFVVEALPLLKAAGFKFARRGGSPEYSYAEGGGVGYEPGRDHPLLIPSVGDARPHWTLADFRAALNRAGPGSLAVLQFHGVPDRQHPWVHTSPERFREFMQDLKDHDYRVLALRDLERYVDLTGAPADPWAPIRERMEQLAATRSASAPDPPVPAASEPLTTLVLASDTLRVELRDNSDSPRILSGLAWLFHRREAPDFGAFDPDTPGASAGLNFEHMIAGHSHPANRFAPRHGPYRLRALPGGPGGQLVRRAADDPWALDSTFQYTLAAPNAVDFEFQCVPRQAELFGQRRYAVCFFANYMNDVADVALHFRGVEQAGAAEGWMRASAPAGPLDYHGGGTYRHAAAAPLTYDEDHNFKLNLWSYDYPRFTAPFYYGRAAHNMVCILMFDRAYTERDEIRFSLFKFKLPQHPRPAWDFQYVIHRVETDQDYGFKGRLVWKRFVSADDCWEEYRRWRGSASRSSP
ncbi:MAG: polysaccharide deacetylase family protein [Verrucomicrobia bacterium]|nr:polysaccharide deacetylase family protein [Verrucomicrobiota bacterium]